MGNKRFFIVWGVLVIGIFVLLLVLSYVLTRNNNDYKKLEDKLLKSVEQYVDAEFLYPEEEKSSLKITSDDVIKAGFLDELTFQKDTCSGYVTVTKNGVYEYKAYIKCKYYKTTGY